MTARNKGRGWLALTVALGLATAVHAQPAGHITGVGGIFVKSKDPKALARWYRDVLGLPIQAWGGAMLKYDAPGHPGEVVWNAFPNATDYMAPSTREFMIDFAVDDLDAFLARLKEKGVTVLSRQADATGAFAWIVDPDGTKIELHQPKAK
jgi:predicted enzyme related to lactoylglutathione lyase